MDITGLSSARPTAPVSVDQTRLATTQLPTVSTPVVKDNGINVTATTTAKPVPPTDVEVTQSIKEVNKYLKQTLNGIEFSQDKDTGQTLVKIIDTTSGKVIRQIPTAQAVEISKDITKLQGLLIKDKA
jgi:flagellar protein FlaG